MTSPLTRRETGSTLTPFLRQMERTLSDWRWPRAFDVETAMPPDEFSEGDDEVVARAQVPGLKQVRI